MNLFSKALSMLAVAAVAVALAAGPAWAEEAKAFPSPEAALKLIAAAGQPGPEHKKLQPLIGEWNVTVRLWTDPNQSPAEAKGTAERKWIMGGRFVEENVRLECQGKTVEGLGLVGYHPGYKQFTHVRACGLSGIIMSSLSTCDASGTKFTASTEDFCFLTGGKVSGRDELIIESPDRIVTNIYKTFDGKEVKIMEVVSTRK